MITNDQNIKQNSKPTNDSAWKGAQSLFAGFLTVLAYQPHLYAQRYSQIVLPFNEDKVYEYHFEPQRNAVVLEIHGANADDLSSLEYYDETIIRRLQITEKAQSSAKIRLFLRDDQIKTTITHFSQPFRIVIDLYEASYRHKHDLVTGYPIEYPDSNPRPNQPRGPKNTPTIKSRKFAPQDVNPLYSSPMPISTNDSRPLQEKTNTRKLLQPAPETFSNSEKLLDQLKKIPEGRGRAWEKYPPYIYPLQLGTFSTGKSYKDFLRTNAQKAIASGAAMADYAAKMFDFGHESRALVAYNQVIHSAPLIFDKHALHLWRLAEIHFGKGNLTLADGYFQSLQQKHPDHPLFAYATMRRLDVVALRLIGKSVAVGYDELSSRLSNIDFQGDKELEAQLAIRKIYWSSPTKTQKILIQNNKTLPKVKAKDQEFLQTISSSTENSWTSFLSQSLYLNSALAKESQIDTKIIKDASDYLKNYTQQKTTPFRTNIQDKLKNRINEAIVLFVDNKDYLNGIKLYESVQTSFDDKHLKPETLLATARAYRLIEQPHKSHPLYKRAADSLPNEIDIFKARFWQLQTLSDTIINNQFVKSDTSESRINFNLSEVDRNLYSQFSSLPEELQNQLFVLLKHPMERLVNSTIKTSSPPNILFKGWKMSLDKKVADSNTNLNKIKTAYSPNSQGVKSILSLAEKFKQLGMNEKYRSTLSLLKRVKPSDFDSNPETEDLWASNLIALAEMYRANNQYLEAGETYTLTGSEALNWPKKSEALYKGGLLLYRAGKRPEAIKSFELASQDAGNLLYSELAKKRLEKLNQ